MLFIANTAMSAQDFNIFKEEKDAVFHRIFSVEIKKPLTEAEITEIAKKIYGSSSNLMLIRYYLAGDDRANAWAVSNFTPKLKVEIFGLSDEDKYKLLNYNGKYDGEIIGRWIIQGSLSHQKTIVKSSNGEFKSFSYFVDGSGGSRKLDKKTVDGQVRFYDEILAHRGIYYTIAADGSLQTWDNKRGMIDRAKPLK